MPAALVATAVAATAMLAAASLSQPIVPVRSYAEWDLELKGMDPIADRDADKLFVDVVAHETLQLVELATRGSIKFTVPIDIAVRRKFGQDKRDPGTGRVLVEEVDALMLLTEEIYLAFMPQHLTDFPAGVWQSTDLLGTPVKDHLRTLHQFTGIVRVTFRVDVAL
jgi:hypothetical protein